MGLLEENSERGKMMLMIYKYSLYITIIITIMIIIVVSFMMFIMLMVILYIAYTSMKSPKNKAVAQGMKKFKPILTRKTGMIPVIKQTMQPDSVSALNSNIETIIPKETRYYPSTPPAPAPTAPTVPGPASTPPAPAPAPAPPPAPPPTPTTPTAPTTPAYIIMELIGKQGDTDKITVKFINNLNSSDLTWNVGNITYTVSPNSYIYIGGEKSPSIPSANKVGSSMSEIQYEIRDIFGIVIPSTYEIYNWVKIFIKDGQYVIQPTINGNYLYIKTGYVGILQYKIMAK